MNLVDSCGWLEYLGEGPNAGAFALAIEDMERLVVPTVVIMEVFKRILQQRGEGQGLRAVAYLRKGKVVDLDASLAIDAALISNANKLSLADSIVLATARKCGATLWTQDADFQGVAGVKYIPHVQRKP